jgi:hypothetical protein
MSRNYKLVLTTLVQLIAKNKFLPIKDWLQHSPGGQCDGSLTRMFTEYIYLRVFAQGKFVSSYIAFILCHISY